MKQNIHKFSLQKNWSKKETSFKIQVKQTLSLRTFSERFSKFKGKILDKESSHFEQQGARHFKQMQENISDTIQRRKSDALNHYPSGFYCREVALWSNYKKMRYRLLQTRISLLVISRVLVQGIKQEHEAICYFGVTVTFLL